MALPLANDSILVFADGLSNEQILLLELSLKVLLGGVQLFLPLDSQRLIAAVDVFLSDVKVVALFTENANGSVSLSLRSRGTPDMNRVAREVGGGGHAYAAGATLEAGKADHDRRVVLAGIRRALREA